MQDRHASSATLVTVAMKPVVVADQARMTELESIRGLAALLVMLFHLPRWNPLLDVGLLRNGCLMVDLFFVSSGFVICRACADRRALPRDLLRFQFLRLARLHPVHVVFLFFPLLIELATYAASLAAKGPDGMVSGAAAFSA
jgi:peptidoglycan/LPS O-acetylase OafA/YrhL